MYEATVRTSTVEQFMRMREELQLPPMPEEDAPAIQVKHPSHQHDSLVMFDATMCASMAEQCGQQVAAMLSAAQAAEEQAAAAEQDCKPSRRSTEMAQDRPSMGATAAALLSDQKKVLEEEKEALEAMRQMQRESMVLFEQTLDQAAANNFIHAWAAARNASILPTAEEGDEPALEGFTSMSESCPASDASGALRQAKASGGLMRASALPGSSAVSGDEEDASGLSSSILNSPMPSGCDSTKESFHRQLPVLKPPDPDPGALKARLCVHACCSA